MQDRDYGKLGSNNCLFPSRPSLLRVKFIRKIVTRRNEGREGGSFSEVSEKIVLCRVELETADDY